MPDANPQTLPTLESNEHPLFIYNQDHPGLVLISQKLTGCENYVSWKRSMKIALSARNKLGIITGEYPEPAVDSQLRMKWERANDIVITWICNTVSDEINKGLRYATSAKMLWQELNDRFSIIDGHRLFRLEKELSSLVQGENSVEVYFHNMKALWDECAALDSTRLPCNCEFGRSYEGKEQRKKLLQFLMGLNDCYTNVRGQILLMNPLPNISQAFYMIKQEETQRDAGHSIASNSNSSSFALAANSRYRKYTPSQNFVEHSRFPLPQNSFDTGNSVKLNWKRGVYCRYCHKEGHTKEECYKLVGYPKDRRNFQPNGDKTEKGYPAAKVMNTMTQRDDNSYVESKSSVGNATSVTKEEFDALQSQMQQLMSMFKGKSTPEDHVYMSGPEPDEGTGLWRAA